MTRYVIQFRANPGKSEEAMKLFGQMKEYFKNRHQKELSVFYQAFGVPGTFQASMDFDNLSQLEQLAQTIRRDSAYQAMAKNALTIFTADSFGTTVYYQV